jgi:endoglucanase
MSRSHWPCCLLLCLLPACESVPGHETSAGGGLSSSTTGASSTGTGASNTTGTGTGTGASSSSGSGTGASSGSGSGTGGGAPQGSPSTFKHGINLGNRLDAPNEGDWGATLDAKDFALIAQRGFDHVRLPVRFSGHAGAAAPYTIDAVFFQRVDWAIDQAQKNKLSLVLDLHLYDELMANPSGQSDRFLGLWDQIATRYKDYPDSLAFELLNEPSGAMDSQWNTILSQAITVVRKTNPKRLIVVDATFWADPQKLASLVLPADANVWAAVHMYEPKLFSFQGKSWMGPVFMTTGIVFPGPPSTPVVPVQAAKDAPWASQWFDAYNTLPAAENPSGPKAIQDQVAAATAFTKATGHPVYNDEWGPQDGGEMQYRAALVLAMREECEKAGINWAIWEDPTNMKLFDTAAGTWVEPVVSALFPSK